MSTPRSRTAVSSSLAKTNIILRMLRPLLLLLLLPASLFAQTTQQKVREYRRAGEHQILQEFTTLLAIPNVASDVVNIRKNAGYIVQMMKDRGLNPQQLETANH